jgi:voltage-gated potassium channel
MRKTIYRLFDDKRDWFDYIIVGLVLLNLTGMVLETVQSLKTLKPLFNGIELFTVCLFTVEYLLKIYSIVENPKFAHPVWGRLKWAFSFMGLVDLFSFLFFWLQYVGLYISALQIFTSLRLIKIVKYFDSFKIIWAVVETKKKILGSSFIIIFFILMIFSVIMYNLEHDAQPEKYATIPDTMYWGMVTMTSVGYGDISPITPAGKAIAALLAVLGITAFAIPVGILAGGFMDYYNKEKTNVSE